MVADKEEGELSSDGECAEFGSAVLSSNNPSPSPHATTAYYQTGAAGNAPNASMCSSSAAKAQAHKSGNKASAVEKVNAAAGAQHHAFAQDSSRHENPSQKVLIISPDLARVNVAMLAMLANQFVFVCPNEANGRLGEVKMTKFCLEKCSFDSSSQFGLLPRPDGF